MATSTDRIKHAAIPIVEQIFEREGYSASERQTLMQYVDAAVLVAEHGRDLLTSRRYDRTFLEAVGQVARPIVDTLNDLADAQADLSADIERLGEHIKENNKLVKKMAETALFPEIDDVAPVELHVVETLTEDQVMHELDNVVHLNSPQPDGAA